MTSSSTDPDIIIIGAGPVGLYLAGLLATMKFSVTVLERKTGIDHHSKSLGIHPVSLELFEDLGIAKKFTSAGLPIHFGHAFIDRKKIGTVSFKSCPKPFNYILTLPQFRTEQILENWCRLMDNISIQRGARLDSFNDRGDTVDVRYSIGDKTIDTTCHYLVGCDGKNSSVREAAGIPVLNKSYPDTYIMGDFTDNTGFGPDAAVYLHKEGLIESFPLPDSNRRWVVKTDDYIENPRREIIEKLLNQRLDHDLSEQENFMISAFGVQHQLADTFNKGRILLAGDSAHVVSPIGGQGMNLGWITASNLAKSLAAVRDKKGHAKSILNSYSKTSRSTAKTVATRAEINMWLGRKRRYPAIRNLIARVIVNTPLQRKMARLFTMRGIES